MVSRHRFDVATWFWLPCGGLASRPRFWVATGAFMWGEAEAGSDIDLRSRPGLLKLGVTT